MPVSFMKHAMAAPVCYHRNPYCHLNTMVSRNPSLFQCVLGLSATALRIAMPGCFPHRG